MQICDVLNFLRNFAPLELAESWDNVGLLIGSEAHNVSKILTCLTLTEDVAAEAVARHAELIITHHPVLFKAVQRITDQSAEGRMLLDLIRAGISVYSPHTSYDSAAHGINRQLAQSLSLRNVKPLRAKILGASESIEETPAVGSGRFGDLAVPTTLGEFVEFVKGMLGVEYTQFVGDEDRVIKRVGIACGAAGEYLRDAAREGCDVFVTGEARFHTCLEAEAINVALVVPGHFATERPAMVRLAAVLKIEFPMLDTWASTSEKDPLKIA